MAEAVAQVVETQEVSFPTKDAELRRVIGDWLQAKARVRRAQQQVELARARKASAHRERPWMVATLEELAAKRKEYNALQGGVDAAQQTLHDLKDDQRRREQMIRSILGHDAWYAYRDDLYVGVQTTNWGMSESKVITCNPEKATQLPPLYIHYR